MTHQSLSLMPFLVALFVGVASMGLSIYDLHARQIGSLDVGHTGTQATAALSASERPAAPAALTRLRAWFSAIAGNERGAVAAELLAPVSGIKAIKQRSADLVAAMKGLQAKLADVTLSKEDRDAARADLSQLVTLADANAADLEQAERIASFERTLSPVRDADAEATARAARNVNVHDRRDDDPRRGYRNMADFALSVRSAGTPGGSFDKRLAGLGNSPRLAAPTGYMQESGGSVGEGFQVPPEFQQSLYEIIFSDEGILAAMNPEPTDASAVEFDADETTPWGSTGVQATWRAEASQLSATKAVTNPKLNKLHELYAFVTATGELMNDLPRLNDRLTRKSGMAIRWKAEDAVVNGDGVGKPLGFAATQNPSRLTVAKDGSQAANTISVSNLSNMYSQLLAEGGSPFWLAHRTTAAQLFGLSIGNQPAVLPNNKPAAGSPSGLSLWGYPLVFSEHAQTLSSLGDVQLVNPAGYICNVKAGGDMGLQFDLSIHLFFDYNLTAFRWIFRIGGQPILSAGVSPKNGTTKRSHSLVLQNR
jgi:HK97 family phage major capsid protein